ncbi:hypothetical protein AAJ76_3000132534 [Vairimorpha ceranae]|uniref:Uncharacterized protein n=1 Tax=Vairimorpha ceranae TaxID=40302 RepID=A0A0F9ZGR9_9MICR|nr:hypothetical protein AAJ76_3000132534 [Vairimorpha ceranae]KKO76464.1 hypothetical protein AAJ76_3000132534 [Vairimorpha ceranae]
MFEKLKELEATLKNFRKGELNTSDTPVTSIVCPKYFSKEEYIELIE